MNFISGFIPGLVNKNEDFIDKEKKVDCVLKLSHDKCAKETLECFLNLRQYYRILSQNRNDASFLDMPSVYSHNLKQMDNVHSIILNSIKEQSDVNYCENISAANKYIRNEIIRLKS